MSIKYLVQYYKNKFRNKQITLYIIYEGVMIVNKNDNSSKSNWKIIKVKHFKSSNKLIYHINFLFIAK